MKNISRKISISVLFVLLLAMVNCASKNSAANSVELPKDVVGIKLGMSKEEAEKRLKEIGQFQADAEKRQQIWTLRDDPNFSSVAIGYNKEGKIRYITAFSEKDKVKEPLRFKDVGDISKAKEEITEPHRRYTWKIDASENYPEYIVTIYGADPEFLSTYSISGLEREDKKKK